MDVIKMLADLRSQKAAVEEALVILERIARAQGGRRGRPPAYLSQAKTHTRRPFSAATKKKMAAAQRKRWAAYRKEQKA